jgi:ABC-type Fe3+-hydroxamate transport system substrate-binding protein
MLIALGGTNAAHVTGWAELSLEDVIRLDPAAIIVVRETPPEGDAISAAGPLGHLDIAAVRDGRLAVLVHPDVNLPSTGVIGVAEALRSVVVAWGADEHADTPGAP